MVLESFLGCDNERLNSLLLFTAEVDKMTSVLRRTLLIDKSRRENDAEHSWHIALMAMIFKDYAPASVDIGRAVQMCIVHDLVEIYAGDTFAFDKEANKDKAIREALAADKLFSTLPKDVGTHIRSLWEEFDKMQTEDAKYASCMDRLQPFLHNTLTDGHTWVQGSADRETVEERLAVVKDFMPEVYKWVALNIDNAVSKGYIKEGQVE